MRQDTRIIRTARFDGRAVLAVFVAGVLSACGSSTPEQGPPALTGGTTGSGSGGVTASGGNNPGTGGGVASGGNSGSSGATGSGGASTGGNASGGTSSGGTASGGAGNSGGTTALPPFDGGITPNNNAVVAGHICDRFAAIQCAAQAHCCDLPDLPSFDACKATQADGCKNSAFLDAITSNPVSGFDAAGAEERFNEFERRSSVCDPGITAWAATPEGLRGVVAGTKDPGATCTSSLITDKPTDAAYLASCSSPATNACLPGGLLGTTWKCAALSDVNGPCFTDVNCKPGLYCANPPSGSGDPQPTGAVCQTRKHDGDSCKAGNECLSLLCRGGACVVANQENAFCLSN